MEEFEIVKIDKGERTVAKSIVTEEVPLTIEVNGSELATLLSSPENMKELVIGFLFTSGFIADRSAVRKLTLDRERWKASVEMDETGLPEDLAFKRIYTSGCGKGVIFHSALDLMLRTKLPLGYTVAPERISELVQTFRRTSDEYRETGGVHSAALADSEKILVSIDDIGRHNAMDKVIGWALLNETSLADKMLLTSGRISSEVISKVVRSGIPVLATAKAPTNQAVKYARESNLTVAGFVKMGRMNIYSGAERIR